MKKLVLAIALLAFGLSGPVARGEDSPGVLSIYEEIDACLRRLSQASYCSGATATLSYSKQPLITDSLVKQLDCSKLTPENVLSFAAGSEQFLAKNHLPVRNWNSGLLGQCWSLSSTQRKFFYFSRFRTPDAALQPQSLVDLVGGEPSILPIADETMELSLRSTEAIISGYEKFREELESKQRWKFFNPVNLGMVFGGRERSEATNEETMKTIEKNLAQGRMPLIVIRASRSTQHVVLVKGVSRGKDGLSRLTIYDSNVPLGEDQIYFKDKQFYAPGIEIRINKDPHLAEAVGVFLKDEDEMDEIQEATYAYYRNFCSKLKPSCSLGSEGEIPAGAAK